MRTALCCACLLAVLATAIAGSLQAQAVCDQLLPIGIVPPDAGFQVGCASRYVLKRPGSTTMPGNYLALAYPPCANGPCAGLTDLLLFSCATRSGYSCCISVADTIPRSPGNLAGPINQGLNQRFASDTDTLPDICFSAYAGNGARVVNVPLVLPLGNGLTQVEIVAFARMFLVRRTPGNGDLLVEFVAEPTPARSRSWGRIKTLYR